MIENSITVYTDHKNLTYQNSAYSGDRVLRQRLVIEEYSTEMLYIKGENTVVADALSRLPISKSGTEDEEIILNRRVFEDTVSFPLDFQNMKEMQDDNVTLKRLVTDKRSKGDYKKTLFQEVELWIQEGKTYVPQVGISNLIK